MFWKRPNKRDPNAEAIAHLFGEEHAQTFEAAGKLEATQDLAAIYLAALKLIKQWANSDKRIIEILATEITQLKSLPELIRIEGMTGYIALNSLLDRVDFIIPATPKSAILPALMKYNNNQPLWKCNPLDDWVNITENLNIDAAPLLFSWEHLCLIYLHTLGILIQSESASSADSASLDSFKDKVFQMLFILNLDQYREGMIQDLTNERPDDAKVAFLVGLQWVYERYQNGNAVGIFEDLQNADTGRLMRDYPPAICQVFRSRNLSHFIPHEFINEENNIPLRMLTSGLIDSSTISAFSIGKLLGGEVNHLERITYLANHDPIVPLCQSD